MTETAQRFAGRSLDDAITAACAGLGARIGEIHYEVMEEEGNRVVVEARVDPAAILGLFLSESFRAGGLDLNARLREEDGLLEVELEGADTTLLTARGGEALDGLQYLCNRVLDRRMREHPPVHMEIGNFKEVRARRLARNAEEAAEAAVRTGRPQTLPPMTPAARRQIHLALAEDDRVETESEGRGFIKRVVVRARRRR